MSDFDLDSRVRKLESASGDTGCLVVIIMILLGLLAFQVSRRYPDWTDNCEARGGRVGFFVCYAPGATIPLDSLSVPR